MTTQTKPEPNPLFERKNIYADVPTDEQICAEVERRLEQIHKEAFKKRVAVFVDENRTLHQIGSRPLRLQAPIDACFKIDHIRAFPIFSQDGPKWNGMDWKHFNLTCGGYAWFMNGPKSMVFREEDKEFIEIVPSGCENETFAADEVVKLLLTASSHEHTSWYRFELHYTPVPAPGWRSAMWQKIYDQVGAEEYQKLEEANHPCTLVSKDDPLSPDHARYEKAMEKIMESYGSNAVESIRESMRIKLDDIAELEQILKEEDELYRLENEEQHNENEDP